MPAHCHDDRPPLFVRDPARPEGGRQRLPEPSPPPRVKCSTPPAEFYRPIYQRLRAPGGGGAQWPAGLGLDRRGDGGDAVGTGRIRCRLAEAHRHGRGRACPGSPRALTALLRAPQLRRAADHTVGARAPTHAPLLVGFLTGIAASLLAGWLLQNLPSPRDDYEIRQAYPD